MDGFTIRVTAENGDVLISANKEGLLSLAGHLTALAEAAGPGHIHLDEYNALEDGSAELIIERKDQWPEDGKG